VPGSNWLGDVLPRLVDKGEGSKLPTESSKEGGKERAKVGPRVKGTKTCRAVSKKWNDSRRQGGKKGLEGRLRVLRGAVTGRRPTPNRKEKEKKKKKNKNPKTTKKRKTLT